MWIWKGVCASDSTWDGKTATQHTDVHTLVRKNSKLQIMLFLWDRIFLVPAETDRERQREREKGGYTDEYVVNFRKWCEKCSGTEWSSSFQSCSPPIGRTLRSDPFWPMRCIVMRVLDPSGPFLKYTHWEKIWSPPHVDYYYYISVGEWVEFGSHFQIAFEHCTINNSSLKQTHTHTHTHTRSGLLVSVQCDDE